MTIIRRIREASLLGFALYAAGAAATESTVTLGAASKAKPQGAAAEQVAVLAGGCYWGMEEFFRKLPGVKSTRVGFAGGTVKDPSYELVSTGTTGHAESVEIHFNPAEITYEHLLELFFKMHDPTTLNQQINDVGTQYRSEIFATTTEQLAAAEKMKKRVEASPRGWKKPLTTKIERLKAFFPGPEDHQKYLVKHEGGYDNHFLRDVSF